MEEYGTKRGAKLKKKRLAALLLMVLLLMGGVVGLLNAGAIGSWAKDRAADLLLPPTGPSIEVSAWNPGENLNILCIGIDKGSVEGETGYCRSDVLMVVSIDLENKRVALVSIPRDTRVEIEGHGTQKINAAHAFDGPESVAKAVSGLTGMGIHGYVEVDFEAFRSAVDVMGGVPIHMDYEILDERVGCLPRGDLLLYGQEALVLVRSRDLPDGDLGRIRNQQKFLTAMAQKLVSQDLRILKSIYDAVSPYLLTDMDGSELLEFAEAIQGIGMEGIQMATIPGSEPEPAPGELWYYIHDPAATARLVSNVERYCMVSEPQEDLEEQVVLDSPADLRLAVLNGTDRAGLAARAVELLEAAGYLPSSGNAHNSYDRTTIYVNPGYSDEASRVAAALLDGEAPPIKVDEELTGSFQVQVLVVIGGDYPE